ncbi:major facilitator super transporter protein, partial [Ascosphaera pollenicola]
MLTLFLITQTRAENIFLFTLYETQLAALATLRMSALERSVTGLVQQYTSFFAFGGSNSIASIDLSSAYNGVSRYDVVAVGVLTFVGNWAGPVWWVVSLGRQRLGVLG